jgi:SAM-dependent methyltransferase
MSNPLTLRQWITIAAMVVVVPYMANQVRKPTRWVGRYFLWRMNQSHDGLTDWGLEHVAIGNAVAILDVGCGGGRTIQKLAGASPGGHVSGVDYSIGSVEVSRSLNADLLAAGRVDVQQATVSKLPFPDGSFDLVTAVETHYYWPDLANDAREVLRVMRPGGVFLVIAEAYKGRYGFFYQLAMAPLRAKLMSADEHRAWLEGAGFADVQVSEARGRGWICATGRRA